jgi:Mg2+ and Co2+ transporter CorA
MSEENINLTISGMLNVRKDIPKEEYENFDTMVKSYIDETQGVLTNIKINGKEIPLNYYNEIKGAFFEGGETVELEFSSKKEVLKDLINQGFEYIEKLKTNLENISKEVLMNTEEGHKMLNSIAEGFEALLNILSQVTENTDNKLYSDEDLKKIKDVVTTIVKAQEDQDYLEVSDIIDFDLPEVIDVFEKGFKEADRILNGTTN